MAHGATDEPQGNADRETQADAERSIQSYLAMWSSNDGVTRHAVDRFYAPTVIYYGKRMERSAVLADKLAYIRHWPVRSYREIPGTLKARCNADRSLCHVSMLMSWRRVSRTDDVSTGRALLTFEFVPADGARKIARESARLVPSSGGHRG